MKKKKKDMKFSVFRYFSFATSSRGDINSQKAVPENSLEEA